jgi:hypothetical protein
MVSAFLEPRGNGVEEDEVDHIESGDSQGDLNQGSCEGRERAPVCSFPAWLGAGGQETFRTLSWNPDAYSDSCGNSDIMMTPRGAK